MAKKKSKAPAKKTVKKKAPKTRPISADDVVKAIDSMVAKSKSPAVDLATVFDHVNELIENYQNEEEESTDEEDEEARD